MGIIHTSEHYLSLYQSKKKKKKGTVDVPDNYRGVSLLSILSKSHTAILNKQLYDWLENNNKTEETQAGLRRGYIR